MSSFLKMTIHQQLIKQLILFFDINGTIISSDAVQGKTVQDSVNQLLAERYSGNWAGLKAPLSYRDFIDHYLCQGSHLDEKLKKQREQHYSGFLGFLRKNKRHFANILLEVENTYDQALSILKDDDLFPSFLKLLQYLKQEKITYTLILRTFGGDIAVVKKKLQDNAVAKLEIISEGLFKASSLYIDNNVLNSSQEILQYIKPDQHMAWQDDFDHWKNHQKTFAYGKPFPIDFDNPHTLSIFFDDNAIKKQIIAIQPTSSAVTNQWEIQQVLLNKGIILEVDTLEAILDEDYYIKHLEKVLEKKRQGQLQWCSC